MSLRHFLHSTRHALFSPLPGAEKVLHVVLGNEAADADSLISTLCHAYFKQSCCSDDELFVPAAGIPREDLVLRRDVQLLLQKINIDIGDLICFDEIRHLPHVANGFMAQKKFKLTLCDHNALAVHLEELYGQYVVEIIDHHEDRDFYPSVQGPDNVRNIAFEDGKPTVMSTCTLIAESYVTHDESVKSENSLLTEDVATVLLAVIALDSSNMSMACKNDEKITTKLQDLCSQQRDELYHLLSSAKFDTEYWRSLSATDALRLDYKVFTTQQEASSNMLKTPGIGISSVLQPAAEFLKKVDCGKSIFDLIERRSSPLTFFAAMSCILQKDEVGNNIPSRQLIVCSCSSELLNDLCHHLLSSECNLELAPVRWEADLTLYSSVLSDGSVKNLYARIYDQGNARVSRKILAPIIISYMEKR